MIKNVEDLKVYLVENMQKLNISNIQIENELIDTTSNDNVLKTFKKGKTFINIEIEN